MMLPVVSLLLLGQVSATGGGVSLSAKEPVQLYDEGTKLGRVSNLNCVGAGVTCTKSNLTGTLTIAGGGGGSANTVAVTVAFGSGADVASTVVTGQAWVTGTSIIVCAPTLLAASGRTEGQEDAVIEGIVGAVHTRSAGVGFTLTVSKPGPGRLYGSFIFHCTGA